MSVENVELHRRNVELWHARDFEAFIATCHPSIEFHTEFADVGGGYHGHDGLRKFLRDFEDAWGDEIRLDPEAYFDLGEHTLAFHVLHGRGRESGAHVAMPVDLRAHGVSARTFGLLLALNGALIVFFQPLVTSFATRFARGPILAAAADPSRLPSRPSPTP